MAIGADRSWIAASVGRRAPLLLALSCATACAAADPEGGALPASMTGRSASADGARACVQRVLREDEELAARRNVATETREPDVAMRAYARALAALDFGGCPEAFTAAVKAHAAAWSDIAAVLESRPQMRGELHHVLEQVRAVLAGTPDGAALRRAEARMLDTWNEAAAAADATR